jgi:hypothetical protein
VERCTRSLLSRQGEWDSVPPSADVVNFLRAPKLCGRRFEMNAIAASVSVAYKSVAWQVLVNDPLHPVPEMGKGVWVSAANAVPTKQTLSRNQI